MFARIIALMVVVIIILIYVLYNTQPVEVKFLFWETKISKALITLGSFLAGIILGLVAAKIDQFNKERKKKKLEKKFEKGGERI